MAEKEKKDLCTNLAYVGTRLPNQRSICERSRFVTSIARHLSLYSMSDMATSHSQMTFSQTHVLYQAPSASEPDVWHHRESVCCAEAAFGCCCLCMKSHFYRCKSSSEEVQRTFSSFRKEGKRPLVGTKTDAYVIHDIVSHQDIEAVR